MDIVQADFALLLAILFYIICCPYTKVEESFNMQAIHDLLFYGPLRLDLFDHLEFPGVVPRTFIGALVVSAVAYPAHYIMALFDALKFHELILCRSTIGLLSWLSFVSFRNGVTKKFGKRAGRVLMLLTALQFHICFYMSRSLPNTFALMLSLHSFGLWLQGSALPALIILAFSALIFRCDMLVLIAPMTLQLLIAKEIPFWYSLAMGILTASTALALTVLIDSIFWRRWLWPEGVVLFFNTVENKSSEWGVMPFYWYFSNAVPKAQNVSLLWTIGGILGWKFPTAVVNELWPYTAVNRLSSSSSSEMEEMKEKTEDIKTKKEVTRPSLFICFFRVVRETFFGAGVNTSLLYYTFPALVYIALYSFLPHKELRFIFPVLPLFTMAAAVGVDNVLPPRFIKLIGSRRDISITSPLPVPVPDQMRKSSSGSLTSSASSSAATDFEIKKGNNSDNEKSAVKARAATHAQTRHRELGGCPSAMYNVLGGIYKVIVMGSLVGMLLVAHVLLSASYHNYPGAVALDRLLNQHIPVDVITLQEAFSERSISISSSSGSSDTSSSSRGSSAYHRRLKSRSSSSSSSSFGDSSNNWPRALYIHICPAAAMSGVTRFSMPRFLYSTRFGPVGSVLSYSAAYHPVNVAMHYLNKSPYVENAYSNVTKTVEMAHEYTCSLSTDTGTSGGDRCVNDTIFAAVATGASSGLGGMGADTDSPDDITADMVFYSKAENESDLSGYDWIITDDPKPYLKGKKFYLVEEVNGFHGIKLYKFGMRVELRKELYILAHS